MEVGGKQGHRAEPSLSLAPKGTAPVCVFLPMAQALRSLMSEWGCVPGYFRGGCSAL